MQDVAVNTTGQRPLAVPAGTLREDLERSVSHAREAHANLQGMVQLADQKAAALMGATGVIVALLGSNLIDRFRAEGASRLAVWLGGLTLLLLLAAALCAIQVLIPRFPKEDKVAPLVGAPRLLWGLDAHFASPDSYVSKLQVLTDAGVVADYAFENLKITWILGCKWKWLGWGAQTLRVAFVAWAAAVAAAVLGG